MRAHPQEQDIVKPNCAQKTVWCFITRLPLVMQVLNLRFVQFQWFVGILSLQSKLRNFHMYARESGSYSPPFCFRTTSTSFAYRFLPSVEHIQIALHLFSLPFSFRISTMKLLTCPTFRCLVLSVCSVILKIEFSCFGSFVLFTS